MYPGRVLSSLLKSRDVREACVGVVSFCWSAQAGGRVASCEGEVSPIRAMQVGWIEFLLRLDAASCPISRGALPTAQAKPLRPALLSI